MQPPRSPAAQQIVSLTASLCAGLLLSALPAGAQSEYVSPDSPASPAVLSEAPPRIVGRIADGTPPPPAPRRPSPAAGLRVLRESLRHENGRTVTYRRVEAPNRGEPRAAKPTPPPPDLSDPEVQARIAAARAEAQNIVSQDILPLSVTVYDHSLSFLRWVWRDPQTGESHPYAAWLEGDASLLEGVGEIDYPDPSGRGRARLGLVLGIGNVSTTAASRNPALAAQIPDLAAVRAAFRNSSSPAAPAAQTPPVPGQPMPSAPSPAAPSPGISAFQFFSISDFPNLLLAEGDPSNQNATAPLRAIAEILLREHDRLAAAREGREKARRQREAHRKAHPPKPKDIILNYSFGPAQSQPR